MNKKMLLIGVLATVLVVGIVGGGIMMVDRNNGARANGDNPSFANGGGRPQMNQLSSIAQILGVTAEELQSQLKAETTLEQIAKDKGMTLEQLKEKLISKEKTDLEKQVSQGELTSDQAQEMISSLQSMDLSKIFDRVAGPPPSRDNARPQS